MSRATSTILTNLCLIKDCTTNKVFLQYRSPEHYKKWSGYAFRGHIEEGESLVESVIREVYEETGLTIADPFMYLNGVGLLFHSFFGIMGRNRKSIPPLLTLDHHYIWFPILTYIIFFLVPALIILISKHLDNKKREEENMENSLK